VQTLTVTLARLYQCC